MGGVPRESFCCPEKKYIRARRKFAYKHLGKEQDFWNNVLWTNKTKIIMWLQDHKTCLANFVNLFVN